MNPDILKRWAKHPGLQWLAAPAWRVLIGAELGIERALDALGRRPAAPGQLDQVTAMIKTFERPRLLERLVGSIRRHYPGLDVVVVDDSEKPARLAGVRTITLPFDSGVSAGRAAGLDAIDTPYTLLLDDDFVFHRHTRLALPLEVLEAERGIDLVGGRVLDLPLFTHRARTGALWPTRAVALTRPGTRLAGLLVVDKTPNFYLARTQSLRKVGWDARIKRLDHADFFTRALGKIVCVQDHRWSVLHARTPFDDRYMRYRQDTEADYHYLLRKHPVAPSS